MKVADLYIRVSTDDQKNGYSPADQEERLRAYCQKNGIQVRTILHEDHSAKTFKRPAWTRLLNQLRKSKKQTDYILFTKWDRFSRNTGDAYNMIGILERLGVEAQAIEQPLDLSIPENRLMLAIYLATPEVENLRRGLNVFYGMRKAKKEGRWMGTAPIGYINLCTEAGKKYIAPNALQAEIMQWAFHELGKGQYNTEQVWKMCKEKGLSCSKNNFWVAIRNPLYCGKIYIPRFKDEDSSVVAGQHEPLITEDLFYRVQDILNGRKKPMRTKISVDENYPLRGFLHCPKCNKLLTASASKGRTQYYHYYHCNAICGFRHKAAEINLKLIKEIQKHTQNIPTLQLFREIVLVTYKTKTKLQRSDLQQVKTQLETLSQRQAKARDLLLSGDIDADDYRIIKAESEEKTRQLEARLAASISETDNIEPLMERFVDNLSKLGSLYENGTIYQKRNIIGSIYPEKLVFDGIGFRTTRINEAIVLLSLIEKKIKGKKMGQV